MPASLAVQARNEAAWPVVLELVAQGHSLRTICQHPDLPSRSTIHRWANEDEEKGRQLKLAMEWRLMTLLDEAGELIDAGRLGEFERLQRYIGRLLGGESKIGRL